jgi:hypothetical protein
MWPIVENTFLNGPFAGTTSAVFATTPCPKWSSTDHDMVLFKPQKPDIQR